MKDVMLRQKEAAEQLGVSVRTLRNWTRERRIPVHQPTPRVVLYHIPTILAAIERRPLVRFR